jgi:hypothetical protein
LPDLTKIETFRKIGHKWLKFYPNFAQESLQTRLFLKNISYQWLWIRKRFLGGIWKFWSNGPIPGGQLQGYK